MSKQVSNGGDLLVKCLLNEGITKMFGIIGGELTRIYDAVERFGREEGNKQAVTWQMHGHEPREK
ncbi:MAG: hypothetical protein ACTSP9_00175 [Promethearchaeota archaeon]